jgi:ubiquinone/menaquinone biosynthesis C-methylase UbiE
MRLATAYDALNTALFLPAGGSRRVRRTFVDALELRPAQRVLEIGCGTGQVTELLVAAGAEVTAVDALAPMIEVARRRAPAATFVEADATELVLTPDHDAVVLGFVLHNFDAGGRRAMLDQARAALGPGGIVGVLEWSLPRGAARAALWRRLLGRIEPSPSVAEILDGGLAADVAAAGLEIRRRSTTAGRRAQILVLTPRAASDQR